MNDLETKSRYRTRGSLSNPMKVQWSSYNSAGSPARVDNVASINGGRLETMLDYVTPNFAERQAKGEIFNNPMQASIEEISGSTVGPLFQRTVTGVLYSLDYNTNWMGLPGNGGLPILNHDYLAGYQDLLVEVQTRARSRIADPDFSSLISLGELGETLHYLHNPIKSGLKLAQNFQRKKITAVRSLNAELRKQGVKGRASYTEYELRSLSQISQRASQIVSDLSDLYLEFRYGVRPLVYDVSMLADVLSAGAKSERQNARAHITRSERSTTTDSYTSAGISYSRITTVQKSLIVRAGFLYEYHLDLSNEKWGFRAADVFQAAWELYPLSFVADWFVNIGDFIGALTPRSGVNYLVQYTSARNIVDTSYTYGNSSVALYTTVRQPSGQYTARAELRNRIPSVGLPALTLRTEFIKSLRHDTFRLLDLFTLTLQRIK